MRNRLPLIFSVSALAIALLNTTALGEAAGNAIAKVPPFATVAGFAKNAGKLNGHSSSVAPKAGQIPVLNSAGKLPSSIGAVGPRGAIGPTGAVGAKGDQGPKGDPGPPGLSQYASYSFPENVPGQEDIYQYTEDCPGDKSVIAAGWSLRGFANLEMVDSYPVDDESRWRFRLRNRTGEGRSGVLMFLVCAKVNS